jgi:flagellar hook-length control protein FliK
MMVSATSAKPASIISNNPPTTIEASTPSVGVSKPRVNNNKPKQPKTTTENPFEKALNHSLTPKEVATTKHPKKVATKPSEPTTNPEEPTTTTKSLSPAEEASTKPVSATKNTPLEEAIAFSNVFFQNQAPLPQPSSTTMVGDAPPVLALQANSNTLNLNTVVPSQQPINNANLLPANAENAMLAQAEAINLEQTQNLPLNTVNPIPLKLEYTALQSQITEPTMVATGTSDQGNTTDQNTENQQAFLSNEDTKKPNSLTEIATTVAVPELLNSSGGVPVTQQPITLATTPPAGVSVETLTAVVDQVGGQLEALTTTGAGNKQVNIVLQPEALGSVRIQLQQSANQTVSGKIIVQTPEAYTALTQKLAGLKERIEAQGITLQKLDIVLAPPESSTQLAALQTTQATTQSNPDMKNQSEHQTTNPEPEAFSMDKYRQPSGQNTEEGGGSSTTNQQERKAAYQEHLNALRGMRSYRAATNRNTYA